MRVQSIVAHPRTNSFCYALFERAVSTLHASGHNVVVHDLYAEEFDPVLKADEAFTVRDTEEDARSRSTDPVVNLHREEIAMANGYWMHIQTGGESPMVCYR